MIISTDAEKAFDKIQYPFVIKTLQKVGKEGTYLNIVKVTCSKPTSNIIFNGEKLKAFPLRSKTRKGCLLSSLLFSLVQEVMAMAIREEKEIKGIQIGKKLVKLSLFAHDMILYMENAKDAVKNYYSSSINLVKLQDTKDKTLTDKNLLYYTTRTDQKEKLKRQFHLPLHLKNKIPGIKTTLRKQKTCTLWKTILLQENCRIQLKEVEDNIKQMERYTIFLDWKNQYC